MSASIAARRNPPARGRGVLEMTIGLTNSHSIQGAAGATRSPRVLAEGAAPREPADARPGVRTSASRRSRGSRAAAATRARAHACAAAYSSAESFRPPSRAAARSYRVGRAGRGAILRSDDMCASRAARGLAEGAVRAPPARARDGANIGASRGVGKRKCTVCMYVLLTRKA